MLCRTVSAADEMYRVDGDERKPILSQHGGAQQLTWPAKSLRLKMKCMQTPCPGVTVLVLLGTMKNVQFSQRTPEDL